MEVLDTIDVAVCPQKPNVKKKTFSQIEDAWRNMDFETRWQNSISGDELVRRVHEHIDEWYATRRKQ